MSDVAQVEKLVAELVGTGTLWPEVVADLNRYVAEARDGTLWEDDFNYLVALHAKVLASGPVDGEQADADDLPAEDWRQRAQEAIGRAERAEAKFDEIKRRFADRYHPDTAGDTERMTRAEVYAEFSADFEDVEKS